jgi:L-ascorbate metabolism protein UlaG (beta-lactamase superfamily)
MMPLMRSLVLVSSLAGFAAATQPRDEPVRAGDINRYRKNFLPAGDGDPKNGAVKVTFLGVSTLLFDDGETQVMTDGFFSRPTFLKVVKGKIETDPKAVDAALKRAGVTRLRALFVSHSHYDHAFDVAHVIKKTGAKLHGSISTLNLGRGGGLKDGEMQLFVPGKEVTIGRFTVSVLKSKHSPPIAGINDDLGEVIDKPLKQPASFRDYKEGGSFDILIRHGEHAMLVKPSDSFLEGALDKVRADVLFLGTASMGSHKQEYLDAVYEQTVLKVRPKLVVPVHWDSFFDPLSDKLQFPLVGNVHAAFDYLIGRLKEDGIAFGIMQGYQSALFFGDSGLPGKKDKPDPGAMRHSEPGRIVRAGLWVPAETAPRLLSRPGHFERRPRMPLFPLLRR